MSREELKPGWRRAQALLRAWRALPGYGGLFFVLLSDGPRVHWEQRGEREWNLMGTVRFRSLLHWEPGDSWRFIIRANLRLKLLYGSDLLISREKSD